MWCRFLLRSLVLACSLFLADQQPLAKPQAYYTPRLSIELPDGCAFVAHGGSYPDLADICAQMLADVRKILMQSWLGQECDEYVFQELEYAPVGHPMSIYLKFVPVARGKFLMNLVCDIGAYNWNVLMLAYDESRIRKQPSGNPVPNRVLPSLIIFPRLDSKYFPSGFSYEVNTRDFDRKHAILYHYDKYLGDGSGGIYDEYSINRSTFIPTLKRSIHKDSANYEQKYQFERGKLPHGPDWLVDDVRNVPRGCLLPLKPGGLPTKEPAISCANGHAVLHR